MIPKDEEAKQFAIMACKPFRHFPTDGSQFPYLGELEEDDTVETILRKLFLSCEEAGIRYGKALKEREIREILGLNNDE